MTRVFIMERWSEVAIDPDVPLGHDAFAVTVPFAGRPTEFMFRWSPLYKYYTLDVVTNDRGRVIHAYVEVGTPIDLEGFIAAVDAPDAAILFMPLAEDNVITPETFGLFKMVVMEGILDEADLGADA